MSAGGTPGTISRAFAPVGEVLQHRSLCRLQLALLGSLLGDFAYGTAITVWAYGFGGAKAVGLWIAIRLAIMAISAPLLGAFADRLPRQRVMITADLVRCVLVIGAAACIGGGTPAGFVFVIATLTSLLGCVFRPALAGWTPSLVDRPEQLTASNAVASTVESIAFFAGPALGAGLIAWTNVQTVLVVDAATFLWSATLLFSIRPVAARGVSRAPAADDVHDVDNVDVVDGADEGHGLALILAGLREIARNPQLRFVGALTAAQTVIAGASPVLWVVFAVRILGTGPRGVGYIDAVLGLGAVVGGGVAIARAAGNRLAFDMTVGVALWSLPLLLVAISQTSAAVVAAAAILGVANPLVDVNGATAIQRVTPDRVLGRVYGGLEGILIATMALGAAVTPFLLNGLGIRTTVILFAAIIGVPALLLLPVARGIDRGLREPDGIDVLRRVSIFAALAPPQLDALARQLSRVVAPASTCIVAEGEPGDAFYVIESGRVRVSHGDEVVREQGPGDHFGEIALLRKVARTATVTAVDDTVLRGLTSSQFLDAVAGSDDAAVAVDEVVNYRVRF